MKKIICFLWAFVSILCLSGCTDSKDVPEDTAQADHPYKSVRQAGSVDELDEIVIQDAEDTVAKILSDRNELESSITTYDEYVANIDSIHAFYSDSLLESEQLGLRMREYAVQYAEMIVNSDADLSDKYDELDAIYDVIYDDAGDEMYSIYVDVVDEMYDIYYAGILDDAYDQVSYDEWSDYRSDAYDTWSDTKSDIYDEWSDMKSEIYDFWSDVKGEVYDGDMEKANEFISDFKEDIARLKEKAGD